jgi:hypothetical protein
LVAKKWLKLHSAQREENLVSPDHTIYVSDFLLGGYTSGGVECFCQKENGCAFAKSIQEIR